MFIYNQLMMLDDTFLTALTRSKLNGELMYLGYVLSTNVYNYLLYISIVPKVWYFFISFLSIKPGTLADLLHTSYTLFYVLH